MVIPKQYIATLKKGEETVVLPVKKDEVIKYCTQIPDGVGKYGGPFLPTTSELVEGFSCSYFDTTATFSPITDDAVAEAEL